MDSLRVASVQIEHRAGDKDYNLGRVEYFTGKAAAEGASVAAFPECCISSYMHLADLSYDELVRLADEVPDGETVRALKGLAAAEKIHILAGLLEIDRSEGGSLYNTYFAVSPEGGVISYRKLHPFVNAHLKAGSEYRLWDIGGWKASCLICYDCNIFENWRVLELGGAKVVFCPHQTGGFDIPCAGMGKIQTSLWDARKRDPGAIERELKGPKGREWLVKWLPSRAYDTGTYVVFSNGVGIDGDEVRTGGAMIIDPHGIIMTETWAAGDDMVVADLKPGEQELSLGYSHTAARRPELYAPIVKDAGRKTDTKEKRDRIRKKLGVDLP
ncbi:MAG: nitrilase-related carbon-nitrogen hydrolase [Gemmatimonadota bacterium]|nr:nitrilase-related carbon-nitrogen hydrolase [Gemmatimonadota bacterium]